MRVVLDVAKAVERFAPGARPAFGQVRVIEALAVDRSYFTTSGSDQGVKGALADSELWVFLECPVVLCKCISRAQ